MSETEQLLGDIFENWNAVCLIISSPELLLRHLRPGMGGQEILADILRTARIMTVCMRA